MLGQRRAGVLLHPTSFPSGQLGEDVDWWLDFMQASGLSIWQTLPMVIPDAWGSPYQSCSAMAANPALLPDNVRDISDEDLERFKFEEQDWITDFALFRVIKAQHQGKAWQEWPDAFKRRDPEALTAFMGQHAADIDAIVRQQALLDSRWCSIRAQAQDRGILLFGDMPIFVALDSADVWSNQHEFLLDADGQPELVAGVPPDYFSETGQRWGNPHYDWQAMQDSGFRWWKARVRRQLKWFDWVRLDHFRGLQATWMIAADCDTAIEGYWEETLGAELLEAIRQEFPYLPIVAEDLGIITQEVRDLKQRFDLPGMAVMQFAFDEHEDNPHKPENMNANTVAYSGTHDNDTLMGWLASLDDESLALVRDMLSVETTEDDADALLDRLWNSLAGWAIAPMQDLLKLDSSARMNTPGVAAGNWQWRFRWSQVDALLAVNLHQELEKANRIHAHA